MAKKNTNNGLILIVIIAFIVILSNNQHFSGSLVGCSEISHGINYDGKDYKDYCRNTLEFVEYGCVGTSSWHKSINECDSGKECRIENNIAGCYSGSSACSGGCPTGKVCSNGACINEGAVCNQACLSGQVCSNYICVTPCAPDCDAATHSCVNGVCVKDCTITTWTPETSTVCSGSVLTQTSNCNTTRSVAGTKTCSNPCGNGVCDAGETTTSCSADCTTIPDGKCTDSKGASKDKEFYMDDKCGIAMWVWIVGGALVLIILLKMMTSGKSQQVQGGRR